MARFSLSGGSALMLVISLALLLMLGLAAAQCRRGAFNNPTPAVLTDSVASDSVQQRQRSERASSKSRKKTAAKSDSLLPSRSRKPLSRDYLDQSVN